MAQQPRKAGGLQMLEKVRKQILSLELQKESALLTAWLWLGKRNFRLLTSTTLREYICAL
jgi:hypothetical protein